MKRWLANLGIKYKLSLMIFLPIMGLLFFAYMGTVEKYQTYDKMKKLDELVHLSIKLSNLVYEIQREHLISVLHLRSQDNKYVTQLEYEAERTAESIQALKQFVADFKIHNYDKSLQINLNQVIQRLDDLDPMRNKVSARQIVPDQAMQLYSELNEVILDFVMQLASVDTEQSIFHYELAYINFLQAQEIVAIERSLLTMVFSQQHFTPEQYRKYIELSAVQKLLFERAVNTYFVEQQKAFYQQTFQGGFLQETQRMEKIALSQDPEQIATVAPEYWSKMQTEKIEVLIIIQKQLASDLEWQAENLSKQAYLNLIYILASIAIIVLLSTLLAYLIWTGIIARLTQASMVATAIKDGDLSSQIKVDSKDETGNLLHILQQMQHQLQKRATSDKQVADEALRLTAALDSVTTSVFITDTGFNIVYANKSAYDLLSTDKVKAQFPHFDVNNLLGTCVDNFHKNPAHQRKLVDDLTSSYISKFNVGECVIASVTTPIINAEGERVGTVAEWREITTQVATEKEISSVIQAASEGDFSQRIGLEDKTDFFHTFSASVNKIIEFNQVAVGDIATIFSALSQGDLTQTIKRDYRGELEQLKNDANITIAKLTESMTTIINSARSVKTAAEEISQANLSLNQRTEEQASALEETAASMQEMTSSVQQNADNATQATQLAINARNLAEKGGAVVGSAVTAMNEISSSSREITDIIDVIDDIAFQTNLLALNAAVEAARAGEQGRGFAVVASEVRNLAQRSASAAKEIKNLIQDSVIKVDEGTKLVNKSGETLDEIVTSVKKVSDIISEISAASQEQSSGIHQVNKAVTQMDEMTQQNAAMVEEAASASESMAEQALILREQTDFFTIDNDLLYDDILEHDNHSRLHQLSHAMTTEHAAHVLPPHQKPHLKAGHGGHNDDDWEDF
ncbi:methyl-accepting chemotaxis protein [Candidatus Albibeggiatoa sp. nov. BB20]|uniref:methyl-accepting chemotaxis protein n=1 Tax=Candidatus Albibeggiatoa sp. nov. BB20 TaxID=3162723 RepID=UPI003365746D